MSELYCHFHPNRETLLRCNRCEKPICTSCAVKTPTGYRCKECVHNQQKIFDTAESRDYIVAFLIAIVISTTGSYLVSFIGFLTILLAPIIGTAIARVVGWAIHKHRSKRLFLLTAGAAVLGSMPILLLTLLGGGLFSILWQGIYTFLVTSTVYYRLL